MKLLKGKKGFTLIELVIVIAILGILAGLAIPRFLDATASARGARCIADLRTIDSAIVIYNAKTGEMPKTDTVLTTKHTDADKNYQLLAKWPVPPTGTCQVTADDNTLVEWSNTGTPKYALDSANGRATLGGASATDILSGTAPSFKS